jgi:hypothetical protein
MRILFLFITFGFSILGSAQINFPNDYLGTWKGNLKMEPSGTEIPMTLQLGPVLTKDSIYKYIITYISPGRNDVREYELHVTDRKQGLFYVDEKNGIILEERLLGNKLSSIFSVSGSFLQITLELLKDEIVFEVYSWPSHISKTTVSKEEEETYTVNSYKLNGYQKAILKK